MSYAELRQHAQRIEELAFETAIKQLRIEMLPSGRYIAPDSSPISDEFVELVREQNSGIAAMFEPFLDLPDPASLALMHEQLMEAAQALASGPNGSIDPVHGLKFVASGEMNKIDHVKTTLREWRGGGAEVFKASFLEPFTDVVGNHFSLVATLMAAIKAEEILWEECRKNLDELAHEAINAFDSMGDHGSASAVILLSLASSIVSVGAAITTGGASAALTAVGAATQVAGTVVDKMPAEEAPAIRLDAKTPYELRQQILEGLYEIAFHVLRKEQQIADAMIMSSETVARMRTDFVSPRPTLADLSRRTILTDQGLGHNA
ncbi:hypothetical protein [Actinoplanes sp. NPDC049802]|uniref:hypothetical protein n=1 Tax=Actinoplanes sp. NPDC049802 TaxID=3154742 RepID=UPI0033D6B00E